MGPYLIRKLLMAPVVLVILATIAFFLIRLAPGGPFDAERSPPAEVTAALRARYLLDRPLSVQYAHFLGRLVRADLGPSYRQIGRGVGEIIASRLPGSLVLGGLAMMMALAMGVIAGVVAAARHNGWADHLSMVVALIGLSIPNFVIAPVLLLVLATHLGWITTPGAAGPTAAYVLLAAFALALPFAGRIARLCRAGMLDMIHQDFVRSARAKGLGEMAVLLRHALRGAMVSVVAYLGPATAALLTGSLVIESVFGLRGLGYEFVNAATSRDYTLVMGTVLVYGTLLIVMNLISDVVLALIDPRVRYG